MEIKLISRPTETINFPRLETINIYGGGKILFHLDQGYFEQFEIKFNSDLNEIIDRVYDGRPTALWLNNPIKRANKLNLNRKDNFYMNENHRIWGRVQALYIHVSEIGVDDLGDRLAVDTGDEKDFLHAYNLTFSAGLTFNRCHVEKIPCDGNWTIPDSGKWSDCYGTEKCPCYSPYDTSSSRFDGSGRPPEKGVIKRWTTVETVNSYTMLTAERYYTKQILSDARKHWEHIADVINENNVFSRTVSYYDVKKLLQLFDMTEK